MSVDRVPFGKFGFISKTASDWMQSNLSTLASAGVLLILVMGWTVYQWNSGSPGDYLAAEKMFNEWKGAKSEELVKLQKLLKTHPELHAKYDGRIAQKLLLSSEQGLADSFARATLKRIGNLSPYYTQFSNGSLLIGEKKFEQALVEAKKLKQMLDQDQQFWQTKSDMVKHGDVLYGYNLLRIAFLEQSLGNVEGELAAWKEFKKQAGWLKTELPNRRMNPEAYALISQNFQKNDVSLQDFIQHRETLLQK